MKVFPFVSAVPARSMAMQHLRHAVVTVVVMANLTGCVKLGPDFQRLEAPPAAQWQYDAKVFQPGDVRDWWKQFNDPVLNRLIEQAHAQNLDLQGMALRIMEARALLGVARGGLFPQQQRVGADLLHNKISENTPNVDTFKFWSVGTGFDVLWEIDLWGKYRRAIEAADARLKASALDYDAARVSLTAEVALTYVQVRAAQQRLELAKRNAKLQHRILRITAVRFRDGVSSELDLQQSKALYFSTRGLIATLELSVRQAVNALSTLLGTYPAAFTFDIDGRSAIPEPSANIVTGIPAEMVRRRPDIRREEALAAAQSALIGVAEAELYPQFSLRGSIGLASSSAGNANLFNLFSPAMLTSVAGPQVTWPILNYGRLRNNVRAQDARLQQALVSYQSTVLRALREVEDSMVGYVKSDELAANLSISVNAASKAVDLALLQYQHGLEDFLSVLNAQQTLVLQQDRWIVSRGDKANYVIALYKALGGGWERSASERLLPAATTAQMRDRTDWDMPMELPAAERKGN